MSKQRIYRFDDDIYHEMAFSEDRDMQEALSEVQNRPCPKCLREGSEWVGWSD